MHIKALVFVLNTFGYRANLVTGCHKQIFVHVFPTFGRDLKVPFGQYFCMKLHRLLDICL